MELYVNCTGLQTSHSAVIANVAKLIIWGLGISKIKLADDLKAVICFLCSILFYLAVSSKKHRKKYQISGQSVLGEAGQTPLNKSCLTQPNK